MFGPEKHGETSVNMARSRKFVLDFKKKKNYCNSTNKSIVYNAVEHFAFLMTQKQNAAKRA